MAIAMLDASMAALTQPTIEPGRRLAHGTTTGDGSPWNSNVGILVERLIRGRYRVAISVPDVAAVLPKGHLIDRSAQNVTLTHDSADHGRTPVITASLANQALAFATETYRPALTFTVVVDDELQFSSISVERTLFRSDARHSYEQASAALLDAEQPHHGQLTEQYRLARRLLDDRIDAGAETTFDTAALFYSDELGTVQQAWSPLTHPAECFMAEYRVLANTVAASWALDHEVPVLYASDPATADRKALLSPLERQTRVRFDTEREPHFILGVDAYTLVANPLNRYADIVSARQLAAAASGQRLPYSTDELSAMATSLSAQTRRVEEHTAGPDASPSMKVRRESLLMQSDFGGPVRGAVLQQIDADRVERRYLDAMVFAATTATSFPAQKHAQSIIEYFLRDPERTQDVLHRLGEHPHFGKPTAQIHAMDDGRFEAVIKIDTRGRNLSGTGVASSKEVARGLAKISCLAQILNVRVNPMHLVEQPGMRDLWEANRQTSLTTAEDRLVWIAEKRGAEVTLDVTSRASARSEGVTFNATVTCYFDGEEPVIGLGGGSTEELAREAAAEQALLDLRFNVVARGLQQHPAKRSASSEGLAL